MRTVDFRSDTVTKPTEEMLNAMFKAEVGDDVLVEDPTIKALEEKLATLFGKEKGLFCVSGTQTNQIAIQVHTQRGGEVICHEDSHIYRFEGGGIARNSNASIRLLRGNRGMLRAEEIQDLINPDDVHFPQTQLVSIEDTVNKGGGAVYNFEEIKKIKAVCLKNNLPLHLDGARIFNALTENGVAYQIYGAEFDSISICLSKGLGAPVGSVLLGSESFIKQARRIRKVMGGGIRQGGYLAAAGIYALDNHVDRLKEDHARARLLGEAIKHLSWVKAVFPVETNIVVLELEDATQRDLYIQKLASKGIKCVSFGPGLIRFVTHLDLSQDDIEYTIEQLKQI